MMRGRWAAILTEGQQTGAVRSDLPMEQVCMLGLGLSLTAGYLRALGNDAALTTLGDTVETMIALLRPPMQEGGDPV